MLALKIPLTTNVRLLSGADAKFQDTSLSMREVLLRSLISIVDGDAVNPVESRMWKMELAKQVQVQETVVLTLTDVLALTPLITRTFAHPLVLNSFLELLENAAAPPAPPAPAPDPEPDLQIDLLPSSPTEAAETP